MQNINIVLKIKSSHGTTESKKNIYKIPLSFFAQLCPVSLIYG